MNTFTALNREVRPRMNRLTQSDLCLQMVAMCLTVVLARAAEAKKSVPFKGFIQADEECLRLFPPDLPFPTLFVEASGSGVATHLGKFTVTYEVEVNLDTFFGVGSSHFIAAYGDSLFTESEGQGTVQTEDGTSVIVETHMITGGTARFDGVSGRFTLVRVINVFTGITSGVFGGTIVKAK